MVKDIVDLCRGCYRSLATRMGFADSFELYIRRWKRFDNYASRRRLFITIIAVLVLVLYIGPLLFRKLWWSSTILTGESNIQCVEQHLRPFYGEQQNFNLDIAKSYEANGQAHVLPYTGNGKFAVAFEPDGRLHVAGRRSLDIPVPYHPLVRVDWFNAKSESATITRFKDGIVNHITCFEYVGKSASIKQTFYTHRVIPSLLVQEIKITNPSDVPLILKLERTGWTGKHEPKLQSMMVPQRDTAYSMLVGHFETSQNEGQREQFIGVGIAVPEVPESVEVNSHSQKTITFRTFVNHTAPMNLNQISSKVPELKSSLREVAKKVLELSTSALERYHSLSWNNLWHSGFGISYSRAPGALNGDVINATIYYVLSQVRAFPSDNDFLNLSDFKIDKTKSLQSDHCYTGHPTLQSSTLWSNLDSISDINRISALWILTLEKQGCHNLVESGAEATMQSMVLSMAALQFTKDHLEFNTHPKELHRNYYIRRIHFGNDTTINITVSLSEDNRAQIFVTLDKSPANREFYACDGGCLDAPVRLSQMTVDFPVKLTDPLTAILYIAADRQHIEELKHAIHVKEVNEAPAHEHHMLVLHQYGHSLGGLPTIFWVIIVFLIVIFHVFLGKLIYNEYCGGGATTYERHRQGRYAM